MSQDWVGIDLDRTRSVISYWLWWYHTHSYLCQSKKSRPSFV